jgi:hypothetical protein
MPGLREHAERSKALYGDSADEVHEYIDSAYEVYRGKHRKIRHDLTVTTAEAEEIFGEKHKNAKDIAIDHVWLDFMTFCYKRGIAYDPWRGSYLEMCFIRFMKPHFVNVACIACKNQKTEKFADVYVYNDWNERYNYYIKSQKFSLRSLIFGSKKRPEFSDEVKRWATLHYCYKCHKLSVNTKEEEPPKELLNHMNTTLERAISEALSLGVRVSPIGLKREEPEVERKKKGTRIRKILHDIGKMDVARSIGAILFFLLGLFFLYVGIDGALSYPKSIVGWIISFVPVGLFSLWLSIRLAIAATQTPTLVEQILETMGTERHTYRYRDAFPELTEEEVELQETQEVDMDFEDEEEDS